MSGIYVLITNCKRDGFQFPIVRGKSPHMTLVHTNGIVKAKHTDMNQYEGRVAAYAIEAFGMFHGRKIHMGELKVNTFFYERENRMRTDVLWHIAERDATYIHWMRSTLLEKHFQYISVGDDFYNDLHVTLKTDISIEDAESFIAIHKDFPYKNTVIKVIGVTTE